MNETINKVLHGIQFLSDLYLGRGRKVMPHLLPLSPILVLAGNIGDPHSAVYWDFLEHCSQTFTIVFYVPGYFEYFGSYSDPRAPKDPTEIELKKKQDIKRVPIEDNLLETWESIHTYITDKIRRKFTNIYYMRKQKEEVGKKIFIGCQWFSYWTEHQETFVGPLSDPCLYIKFRDGHYLTAKEICMHFSRSYQWLRSSLEELEGTGKEIIVITSTLPTYDLLPPEKKRDISACVYATETRHTLIHYPISTWICGGYAISNAIIINHIPIGINGIGFPGERPTFDIIKKREEEEKIRREQKRMQERMQQREQQMKSQNPFLRTEPAQEFFGPKTF